MFLTLGPSGRELKKLPEKLGSKIEGRRSVSRKYIFLTLILTYLFLLIKLTNSSWPIAYLDSNKKNETSIITFFPVV